MRLTRKQERLILELAISGPAVRRGRKYFLQCGLPLFSGEQAGYALRELRHLGLVSRELGLTEEGAEAAIPLMKAEIARHIL